MNESSPIFCTVYKYCPEGQPLLSHAGLFLTALFPLLKDLTPAVFPLSPRHLQFLCLLNYFYQHTWMLQDLHLKNPTKPSPLAGSSSLHLVPLFSIPLDRETCWTACRNPHSTSSSDRHSHLLHLHTSRPGSQTQAMFPSSYASTPWCHPCSSNLKMLSCLGFVIAYFLYALAFPSSSLLLVPSVQPDPWGVISLRVPSWSLVSFCSFHK